MKKLYVIELVNSGRQRLVWKCFFSWREAQKAFDNLPILTEWRFAELRTYTRPTDRRRPANPIP